MSSVNAMISGCGVEFPGEEDRDRTQDLVVLAQSPVLRPQPFDLRLLVRARAWPVARVDVGLDQPAADRLPAHPQPGGHRQRQRGIRRVVPPMVRDHP
jgi:hypothetical protein